MPTAKRKRRKDPRSKSGSKSGTKSVRYAVCEHGDGFDLIRGKQYRVLPGAKYEAKGFLRVIDENGADYIYFASRFREPGAKRPKSSDTKPAANATPEQDDSLPPKPSPEGLANLPRILAKMKRAGLSARLIRDAEKMALVNRYRFDTLDDWARLRARDPKRKAALKRIRRKIRDHKQGWIDFDYDLIEAVEALPGNPDLHFVYDSDGKLVSKAEIFVKLAKQKFATEHPHSTCEARYDIIRDTPHRVEVHDVRPEGGAAQPPAGVHRGLWMMWNPIVPLATYVVNDCNGVIDLLNAEEAELRRHLQISRAQVEAGNFLTEEESLARVDDDQDR